jgi:serine/threonine protein kinase
LISISQLLEVAEAIQYLHSEGIIHGDLHGVRINPTLYLTRYRSVHLIMYQGNVLLDSQFHCQIADFGSTRHFDATVVQSTKTFVPNFAAPELFGMCSECCQLMCEGCCEGQDAHKRKTMETDVYAFGCLHYSVRLNYSLLSL